MRRLIYVIFGLLVFVVAAGLLVNRQMQVVQSDSPAVTQGPPAATQADRSAATRGLRPDRERSANRWTQRRYDRGIDQYKSSDGGWNIFAAALDVLNVIVGIIGIGLAISGMRARRDSNAQRQS